MVIGIVLMALPLLTIVIPMLGIGLYLGVIIGITAQQWGTVLGGYTGSVLND
jgi:hypothetical protein